MNKSTLIKLASNPHYKMTPEQQEEYQNYLKEENNVPVKNKKTFTTHNFDTNKHNTSIENE
jgi:hypothetical protein